MVKDNDNLAEKMADEMMSGTKMTFDEFYDKYKVPKKNRIDFASIRIMEVATKICQERRKQNGGK